MHSKNDQKIKVVRPDWPAPVDVQALCTTRQGGLSVGPYDSLNLANHVGDSSSFVESNRDLLQQQFAIPEAPYWLNQTHSTRVTLLDRTRSYAVDSDAAITRDQNVVAVVMTADCLPILLCNQQGTEVAAIHAGWRGLVDGVIENTLNKMEADAEQLLAWIGPAISQRNFEVGRDVFDLFVEKDSESRNFFEANRPGHWLCDLPGLAAERLRQQGLSTVLFSGLCSYEDEESFFSYRRNKITGRMASLIWINSQA